MNSQWLNRTPYNQYSLPINLIERHESFKGHESFSCKDRSHSKLNAAETSLARVIVKIITDAMPNHAQSGAI